MYPEFRGTILALMHCLLLQKEPHPSVQPTFFGYGMDYSFCLCRFLLFITEQIVEHVINFLHRTYFRGKLEPIKKTRKVGGDVGI